MNGEYGFSKVPQAGRCAACKTLLNPDLEQGGNTNLVVRCDPATGDTPAFSSIAGAVPDGPRGRPQVRWPMLEPLRGNLHVQF
jgi:hypothetical protein